jgi:hypothetical protein
MSFKLKNSDGTNYKGAKVVKTQWKASAPQVSLKTWARNQPKDSDAYTWLFNKTGK